MACRIVEVEHRGRNKGGTISPPGHSHRPKELDIYVLSLSLPPSRDQIKVKGLTPMYGRDLLVVVFIGREVPSVVGRSIYSGTRILEFSFRNSLMLSYSCIKVMSILLFSSRRNNSTYSMKHNIIISAKCLFLWCRSVFTEPISSVGHLFSRPILRSRLKSQ